MKAVLDFPWKDCLEDEVNRNHLARLKSNSAKGKDAKRFHSRLCKDPLKQAQNLVNQIRRRTIFNLYRV